jgi:transposase-like protein
MAEIICKGCGASNYVKNGYVRGLQRYRCKECGCNFTATAPRGKPAAMKALALLLYAMANVSFGSIARLLKVSDVAVLKWVRAEARKLPEPEPSGHIAIVTLDEMWHFLKKKTNKLWLWRAYDPVQRRTIAWVLGDRDDATPACAGAGYVKGFSIKSAWPDASSSPTTGKAITASSPKTSSLPART